MKSLNSPSFRIKLSGVVIGPPEPTPADLAGPPEPVLGSGGPPEPTDR